MRTHDFRSVDEILRFRAQVQREGRAYTFLSDGESESSRITYGKLDGRSRAIASVLQHWQAQGERALLLYPPGLDFIAAFLGCLSAGVVAVPAYPPHPAQPRGGLSRVSAIAKDARISVILSTEALAPMGQALALESPELAEARWLTTDRVSESASREWGEPGLDRDTPAFLQYTSGSTAEPKGVMVSHGNLLHNLAYINSCERNDDESVSVSWLPFYHDMGLIEGILEPLFCGYPVYLMPPTAFLQRPIRWLQAISRYRATNSGGPNFAYDLCLRKITPEQREGLDLRCWRIAYNGAEPVRYETMKRFAETFEPRGFRWSAFYPVYGQAEATLVITSGRRPHEPLIKEVDTGALSKDQGIEAHGSEIDTVRLVACGPPEFGTSVVIVHPESLTPCEPGTVGEIWTQSPSVTKGYWNRPEETERTFRAYLESSGAGPYLRTGDLGFMLDGELFVTGRIKDLLIVRGRKHYPQDIELTVERSHPAIRAGCSAVCSVQGAGGEQLVVVAEVDPRRLTLTSHLTDPGLESLIGAIRQAVSEQHELQVAAVSLLKPGEIPKTTSGKLRRHACRERFLAGTLDPLLQWSQGTR